MTLIDDSTSLNVQSENTSQFQEIPGQLTRHPVGTVRELWSLSYPLMASLLSSGLAIVANRLFLANYSLASFNAVSEAAAFFMTIEYTILTLAIIAEVLVGKAYGAREYARIGKPVWTMMWLSLLSFVVFYPLAIWGSKLLFSGSPNKTLAISYFSTLCFFGPLLPFNAALSSFWIGRGKTSFVTYLVAGVSILNVVLDPILIFGCFNLPALGVKGAAIARGISQFTLACALIVSFLSRYNRERYKTNNWRFDKESCKEIFSFGSLQAMAVFFQYGAWSTFFRIMSLASQTHVLASGIADAIYFLFSFIIEGVSKAATSLSANLLGANKFEKIGLVSWAGLRLLIILASVMAVILLCAPNAVIKLFLPKDNYFAQDVWHTLRISLIWIWLILIGEAHLYFWSGILLAFEDTRFILFVSSFVVWICGVLPAYLVTNVWKLSADIGLAVTLLYYVITGVAYLLRVRSWLSGSCMLNRRFGFRF